MIVYEVNCDEECSYFSTKKEAVESAKDHYSAHGLDDGAGGTFFHTARVTRLDIGKVNKAKVLAVMNQLRFVSKHTDIWDNGNFQEVSA